MTTTKAQAATEHPRARTVDMKLEVVVIPVSDVDRAKRFYGSLGWRLDADFVMGDDVPGRTVHASRLAVLDPLRHGSHVGRAGLGTRDSISSCPTSRQRAPSSSIAVST